MRIFVSGVMGYDTKWPGISECGYSGGLTPDEYLARSESERAGGGIKSILWVIDH